MELHRGVIYFFILLFHYLHSSRFLLFLYSLLSVPLSLSRCYPIGVCSRHAYASTTATATPTHTYTYIHWLPPLAYVYPTSHAPGRALAHPSARAVWRAQTTQCIVFRTRIGRAVSGARGRWEWGRIRSVSGCRQEGPVTFRKGCPCTRPAVQSCCRRSSGCCDSLFVRLRGLKRSRPCGALPAVAEGHY